MIKKMSVLKTVLWMAMIVSMLGASVVLMLGASSAQADSSVVRVPRLGFPRIIKDSPKDSPGGDAPPSSSLDTLDDLKKAVVALQAQAQTQQTTIRSLQAKLAAVSVSGNDFTISGKNVRIVDGSGKTESKSGLGNLIVGYNEQSNINVAPQISTGSHNIVLGTKNNYSSFGGFVAGFANTISAPFASVSGGGDNTAEGYCSSVSGGSNNLAKAAHSSVSGGSINQAIEINSSVSGGSYNKASGDRSSVSGGNGNKASGDLSSVSGGNGNKASGFGSSVSGGKDRTAADNYNWRAGSLLETN